MQADLFFSFRSPYSYLATPLLRKVVEEWEVELHLRVMMPLALRQPTFFKTANPLLPFYILRDSMRIAEYHGIPYSWPQPDPVVQDPGTLTVAEEQPYIHRLTRLGACDAEEGDGFRFACEVAQTIWSGRIQGWDEGTHLAEAASRAGFELSQLDAKIEHSPDTYDDLIEANHRALKEAGQWGVPTLVYNDEPFWGQDRIDVFLWRLRQNGLERR